MPNYITQADLTAYGIDISGNALIPAAIRVVDLHTPTWPVNGDGRRFPRLQDRILGVVGDYAGKATLSATITSSQTTLVLAGDTTGYPTGTGLALWLRIEDEVMVATANSAGAVSGLTRGYGATLAAAHAAGQAVTWAVVPQGVRDACCEQVAWLLNQGTQYQLQGGDDHLVATSQGASRQRARADSPLLAPLAKLMLRPYMSRIGRIQAGI